MLPNIENDTKNKRKPPMPRHIALLLSCVSASVLCAYREGGKTSTWAEFSNRGSRRFVTSANESVNGIATKRSDGKFVIDHLFLGRGLICGRPARCKRF